MYVHKEGENGGIGIGIDGHDVACRDIFHVYQWTVL
jgi:hypothetical protein